LLAWKRKKGSEKTTDIVHVVGMRTSLGLPPRPREEGEVRHFQKKLVRSRSNTLENRWERIKRKEPRARRNRKGRKNMGASRRHEEERRTLITSSDP